jgi:hypothetical protein
MIERLNSTIKNILKAINFLMKSRQSLPQKKKINLLIRD